MLFGGKSAVLDYNGILTVGKTEEIINETLLRKIYRSDLHVIYVDEISRNICVCGSLDGDDCPICATNEKADYCCEAGHSGHHEHQ